MTSAVELSVIVPAFDEAPHVRAHLARICAAMTALGRPFEVLLVDDGSRDATAAEADAAALTDPRIRVLRHARNEGKGAALASGCGGARGGVLVFLDADLEIAPEQVGPLLARLEADGADVAVGSKYAPGASQRRPLHRVLLSRLYLVVTSVLFRLPIADTQTGLKLLRREIARAVVPAIRTRRWAWDIELLVLAHRLGARIVSGPVAVDFLERGTRIGWRGFLASGVDTLATFVRDRGLGAYGAAIRKARAPARARARGVTPRGARVEITGDDLGLSPGVDAGLLDAACAGSLTAVSLLVDGPTAASAAAAWRARAPAARLGVHVDLAPGSLGRYLVRAGLGLTSPSSVRAAVRDQVARARSLGLSPAHVDAHRHAFFLPHVYRAFAAEAAALGIPRVRRPTPRGALRCGDGIAGFAKGLVLAFAGVFTRGVPRAYGLATTAGIADAAEVERWLARPRLPRALREGSLEIVAHPATRDDDVPASDRGLARRADAERLRTLPARLERRGAGVGERCGASGVNPCPPRPPTPPAVAAGSVKSAP